MKINSASKALIALMGLFSASANAQLPNTVANPDTIVTNITKGKLVISTLLNNDTDPDAGDTLYLINVGLPKFGKAEVKTVNGAKVVEYTPNNRFKGTDSFSYGISDRANGTGNSATSTVTISNPFISGRGNYGASISGPGGPQDVTHDVSGYISMKVSPNGLFTCLFRFAGKSYRFKSSFEVGSNGAFVGVIDRTSIGLPDITLELNYAMTGSTRQITGAAIVAAERIAFTAPHSNWLKSSPPSAFGNYTVLLPAPNTLATTPQGNGFATMVISRTGGVACIGRTGDGRGFSSSTFVGQTGTTAPVYGIVHSLGSIFGNFSFAGVAPRAANVIATATGNLRWFAAKNARRIFFPKGFNLTVAARASAYTKPFVGTIINPSTQPAALKIAPTSPYNSNLTVSAGDFSAARTERASLGNLPTAGTYEGSFDNLRRFAAKLVVSPKNGTFSGAFYDVTKKKRRSFKGIFLQSENKAFGVWKSPSRTGKVELTPDAITGT